ncbi:hypothetical protein RI129_011912 [Pyrocoelia pectoralis]|uniref:Uncharacterized protein n=1 Tax=Pyrocoelia pectoralis TaxID=417401 RepID=A0AAN7UXU0_9COLE
MLAYGVINWGNSSDSVRVFISQKRVIRLICNLDYRQSCRKYFIKYKILTFPCLYIYKLLIYIHKNKNHLKILSDQHNYNTRNRDAIILAQHRYSSYQKSPEYAGSKLYNGLPNSVRNLNLNKFKYKKEVHIAATGNLPHRKFVTERAANHNNAIILFLKCQTRTKRGTGVRSTVNGSNVAPRDWQKFLQNAENKQKLIQLLTNHLRNMKVEDKTLIVTSDESAFCTSNEPIQSLYPCTHEEADTRINIGRKQGRHRLYVQKITRGT